MHKSVLLQETIELLALKEGDVVVDATVGAGGHSQEILKKIGTRGVLIGIDQDESALKLAEKKLKGKNVKLIRGNFRDIKSLVHQAGYEMVNAIIADIGVSSMQLDQGERGFSFKKSGPLDMRMDQSAKLTAKDVVNKYTKEELTRIFREYGEERQAKKIAEYIVEVRATEPIISTDQLAEVVRRVKRAGARQVRNSKFEIRKSTDPATKVFQALRIEVNEELKVLTSALPQLVELLSKGGRFAIISFHSLEDRIVKNYIEENSRSCNCPPESPVCNCRANPSLKKITKKPVIAGENEILINPRARSAKLRVAEKIK